ncbi:hypothetical protein D3Z48_20935 [Clostridiaceae bacterium]|nr:hypothetical protein [Clostridiaceae bacterium]
MQGSILALLMAVYALTKMRDPDQPKGYSKRDKTLVWIGCALAMSVSAVLVTLAVRIIGIA